MNRKLKNTLGLVGLFIIILIAGGIYVFIVQRGNIREKEAKLTDLKSKTDNTSALLQEYDALLKQAAVLDSVLAARKFNIPANLSSIKFFRFINDISTIFAPEAKVDIEYVDFKPDKEFFFHEYKLTGSCDYNELYKMIYSIEQSKELKKVKSVVLSNQVITDKHGMPDYEINFDMGVNVYFASDDRFATKEFTENDLSTRPYYDIFYPLIRNEIPPNIDDLLDVQGARLLALIPEGAFIADARGNTYLLWEGEQVYLGYLTKIDYDNNRVSFILNKGGIIESVDLDLKKEKSNKKKESLK